MLMKTLHACRRRLLAAAPHGGRPTSAAGAARLLSTELTTALRPFYFAVHPDLFGQHPEQRSVNENSLQQLSSHIACLHDQRYHMLQEPRQLRFYIRDMSAGDRDTFKLIRLTLDQRLRDPRRIVERLLELCDLPTDYVRTIKSQVASTTSATGGFPAGAEAYNSGGTGGGGGDYAYGSADFADFERRYHEAAAQQRRERTLETWLRDQTPLARLRSADLAELRAEVAKLQHSVAERLGLLEVRYECGWNFEHFRGCLKTLERLSDLHPPPQLDSLRGRILVFAAFTGISLEGHVMLFTGDVLSSWMEFINRIPHQDRQLKEVPRYERTLSQVLRHMRIGRRRFTPKQQAVDYVGHLMKVTTTLGDYLTVHKFPLVWPASLEEYEIVIESEAGPLTVNPSGQLIVPATCPGFMLIDFITTSLAVAKERMRSNQQELLVEQALMERCVREMRLKTLTKDDSITPGKMIGALELLLAEHAAVAASTAGDSKNSSGNGGGLPMQDIDLHITNYYSVLADGIVCIPWDFPTR